MTSSKIKMAINEDNIKNEDNLKNEDDLKNKDDFLMKMKELKQTN